jgi:hypothetical protein
MTSIVRTNLFIRRDVVPPAYPEIASSTPTTASNTFTTPKTTLSKTAIACPF